MSRRKTIKIADLIARVNMRNRLSTCAPAVRTGWILLLEEVLHEANVYSGYSYLTAENVPAGQLPGVTGEPGTFTFPDESRRHYHTHCVL